jgi:hypothetical protein
MRYLSLTLVGLALLMGCNGQSKSNNLKNIFADIKGLYQKREDSSIINLRLVPLNDSIYYYELVDVDTAGHQKQNNRNDLGMLRRHNNKLFLLSTDGTYHFTATITKDAIKIDSANFNFFSDFNDIVGYYSKRKDSLYVINFGEKVVGTHQWEEGEIMTDCNIRLYTYPYRSIFKNVNFKKGEKVNYYFSIQKAGKSAGSFFLVNSMTSNGQFIEGWVDDSLYYQYVKRKYKCERYDDGRIEKWNKEEGYTLYFDASGKLVSKKYDREE